MSEELTVLITTRNRTELLTVALKSVRTSFGEGTNVIIGDNGNSESTRELLASHEDFSLRVRHLANPRGYSYTDNLKALIAACQTPWLSLLHDDDFFTGSVLEAITRPLQDPTVSFIFSDHWIADNGGRIDEAHSVQNTARYGRQTLAAGLTSNLGELAIQNSICLDGFFVRRAKAQQIDLDVSLPVYAENRWMIELCFACGCGYYIKDRLFAYRHTAESLTAQGMDRVEIYRSLAGTVLPFGVARTQLNARIRRAWWSAFKGSVKKGTAWEFTKQNLPWKIPERR